MIARPFCVRVGCAATFGAFRGALAYADVDTRADRDSSIALSLEGGFGDGGVFGELGVFVGDD